MALAVLGPEAAAGMALSAQQVVWPNCFPLDMSAVQLQRARGLGQDLLPGPAPVFFRVGIPPANIPASCCAGPSDPLMTGALAPPPPPPPPLPPLMTPPPPPPPPLRDPESITGAERSTVTVFLRPLPAIESVSHSVLLLYVAVVGEQGLH